MRLEVVGVGVHLVDDVLRLVRLDVPRALAHELGARRAEVEAEEHRPHHRRRTLPLAVLRVPVRHGVLVPLQRGRVRVKGREEDVGLGGSPDRRVVNHVAATLRLGVRRHDGTTPHCVGETDGEAPRLRGRAEPRGEAAEGEHVLGEG